MTGMPGGGCLASVGSMLMELNEKPTFPVFIRVISAAATWSYI